jgi:hypothetical protein
MSDARPDLPPPLGPEDSIVELLHQLDELGYEEELVLEGGRGGCASLPQRVSVDELVVDAIYRTEGESNPDDEQLIAALRAPAYDWRGVLITGFGPSVPADDAEFLRRLTDVAP